ncbi:MAG: hypothetical protein DLM66_08325 [Candidatus Dormiibacter spiritus]|nr:MAG: hypothetical protein DLM66_08325 [Candidatus Dormibacteraeota bacterium]
MLKQAETIGMRVQTVLADHGFGNELTDQVLSSEGIADKVPRVGRPAPKRRQPGTGAAATGGEPATGASATSNDASP